MGRCALPDPGSGRRRSSVRRSVRDARCSSATDQRPVDPALADEVHRLAEQAVVDLGARQVSAIAWRSVQAASSSSPSRQEAREQLRRQRR